jgi:hypothetical protein
MDKEEIIKAVESQFVRYLQDKVLMDALRESNLSLRLMCSKTQSFYLCGNGEVINDQEGIFMVCDGDSFPSTLEKAAESYVEDCGLGNLPSPAAAVSALERGLGKRVEEFKKDYQQNFRTAARKHWDCGRNYI